MDYHEIRGLIIMRLEYLRLNNPPTNDEADFYNQGKISELKFMLNWIDKLEQEGE